MELELAEATTAHSTYILYFSCHSEWNFNSAQWYLCAITQKGLISIMSSTPSLRNLFSVAFEIIPMFVWLMMTLSIPFQFQRPGRSLTECFLFQCHFPPGDWWRDVLGFVPTHLSQDPQHFATNITFFLHTAKLKVNTVMSSHQKQYALYIYVMMHSTALISTSFEAIIMIMVIGIL